MKKILLATTVLVGTAGFAAAEVTLSGSAAMGVVSAPDGADNEKPQFSSLAKVNFKAALETDGGLSLGASFGASDATDAKKGTAGTVSISGFFGKLEMGKNYSATDTLVGTVSEVGFSGNMSVDGIDKFGADAAPNALYTYKVGDLSVSASIGSPRRAKSAAVKYETDVYSVAVGYENNVLKDKDGKPEIVKNKDGQSLEKSGSQVSLGGSVSVADAKLTVVAVDDLDASKIGYAASVDYSVSDVDLTLFGSSNEYVGLGGAYDLGDGAKFKTGVMKKPKDQKLVYDAGVTFSF